MKRNLTDLYKFSLIVACFLLLNVPSFSQSSLNKALDFDGDNKVDFAIFRPSNGIWFVKLSGGGKKVIDNSFFNLHTQDFLTPGSYDNDNMADYCVWRASDGGWFRYNSSDNTPQIAQFGVNGDRPVSRDYDGDGKTDYAIVRPINDSLVWYVLQSSDNALVEKQFGKASDFAVPGDYDGDGDFEYAVHRPGINIDDPGAFYISLNNGGYSQTNFGMSNDLVVPGDYDGDGKTDIAVVRTGLISSSVLEWHILKSTGGIKTVEFGFTGLDHTVQGDYDGDLKTDIAVWRESTKSFYVLRSSDNGISIVQWGEYGDFPIANYDTH